MATKKKVKDSQSKVAKKSLVSGSNLQKLYKLNLWLALAFFVQAVAVLLFGGSKSAPVTSQFLSVDQLGSQGAGHQVLSLATRHLFDIRFTVVAAAFLLVFSFTCLAMATICRGHYETQLERNSNSGRWLGFALAGSFMTVALGLEGGVYDLAGLLAIFVLTVIGVGLLVAVEKLKAFGASATVIRSIFVAALCLAILPWVILTLSICSALLWAGHIPANVYIMYLTSFLLFGCWLLAMRFRATGRGKWSDVVYSEKMYMFLSIAIGTILAWQIFAGAM